jgi:hypothetical protein
MHSTSRTDGAITFGEYKYTQSTQVDGLQVEGRGKREQKREQKKGAKREEKGDTRGGFHSRLFPTLFRTLFSWNSCSF